LLRGIGTFGPAGSAAARRFVPREGQVVAEEDREAGLALVLAHFGPSCFARGCRVCDKRNKEIMRQQKH
jgi:hypothetical protein